MIVAGGATNVTTYFAMRLSADGTAATGLTATDFDLQYVRSGAAPSTKVDATAGTAGGAAAHTDNTVVEPDATDQPGLYRVDWPDAAFAAGVREVILTVKVATAFTEHLRVEIDAEVNVVEWAGTDVVAGAIPAAAADAAGGLVISDAGGLDIDAMNTNINDIETDTATTIPGTITTLQNDLDTITGSDGVTLATAQALYAPAKAGDAMALSAGAVTDAALAGNMEIVFETDFATNYNATRNAWATNVQDTVGTGTLGLNDVAATDIVSSGAITTAGGAVSNVTLVATTTTNTDMRGTDNAALASVATEARLSELDAATAGKAANQIDIIQTDTTTDIPALIADVPTVAEFNARTLVAASYFDPAADTVATVTNVGTVTGNVDGSVGSVTAEVTADVTKISGSATAADNLEASALGIIPGTAQTGTLSTTVMTTDLTGYVNDELIGRVVVWTGGDAAGQASDITDYASASGTVTYTAITTAPANNDTFVIV